jgi:hypothetical protein
MTHRTKVRVTHPVKQAHCPDSEAFTDFLPFASAVNWRSPVDWDFVQRVRERFPLASDRMIHGVDRLA